LAEIYDEHADFVYRTLIGLRLTPHAAEDALQEVFLVVHRRLPEFEGTFLKAWLYRIARSVAQNAKRSFWRRTRRSVDVELEALPGSQAEDPHERAVHREHIALLQTLLAELGEKEREVFILAELEQLPREEIAGALGIHLNTVTYRLKAARERLERLIKTHGRMRGGDVG
jgi:RNA polymerase sigma-70 factor (ECF subfamily)